MADIISFKDFLKTKPQYNRAAVTGAGPSLARHEETIKKYPCIIGVNYTYKIIPCQYLFVSHGLLLFEFYKGIQHIPEGTTIVYPEKMIDFIYQGPKSPPVPGIRYQPYQDLYCGTSTILPALHFASMIAEGVNVYGMDLAFTEGKQYHPNYPGKQQSPEVFNEWAEVVIMQLAHMKNHMGLLFNVIG